MNQIIKISKKNYTQCFDVKSDFMYILLSCHLIMMSWPHPFQRAKKVVSDNLGLVDFAIGLVNSVFNLPDGQVLFS